MPEWQLWKETSQSHLQHSKSILDTQEDTLYLQLLLNSFVHCQSCIVRNNLKKATPIGKAECCLQLPWDFSISESFPFQGHPMLYEKVKASSLHQKYLSRTIPRSYRVLACPSIEGYDSFDTLKNTRKFGHLIVFSKSFTNFQPIFFQKPSITWLWPRLLVQIMSLYQLRKLSRRCKYHVK